MADKQVLFTKIVSFLNWLHREKLLAKLWKERGQELGQKLSDFDFL